MFKHIILAILCSVTLASTAQSQTLSNSFDRNERGVSATLIGLGNVHISKNGKFSIMPTESWSLSGSKQSSPLWAFSASYLGTSRGNGEMSVGVANEFSVDKNKVSIVFPHSILKYDRLGSQIEQLIVINDSPAGKGDLKVGFKLSSGLKYQLEKDGGFSVSDNTQQRIRFGGLTTHDASGRILPSHIELSENRVRYVVEDEGAVFPITIDPLVSQPTLLVEGQNNGEFAVSMATLDINGDNFSDLIIGEDRFSNGQNVEGKIYLFLGSANGLAATAKWAMESDEANSKFGATVRNIGDINGDGNQDFAVGAELSSKGTPFGGQVSVFLGDDVAPGMPVWQAEGTTSIEIFGADIASGDFNCDGIIDIAISSEFFNDGGTKNGRVQIYNGSAVIPYFASGSSFSKTFANKSQGGTALVAANINGDSGPNTNKACMDLIVGRPRSNSGGNFEGGFDIFLGTETGPSTTPSRSYEGNKANGRTGFDIVTADFDKDGFDDLIVSSYKADSAMFVGAGMLTLYKGNATGMLTPSWEVLGDSLKISLGYSLAVGDFDNNGFVDVVAGAPGALGDDTIEGRAYVYLNANGILGDSAAWSTNNAGQGSRFGDAVDTGDVNNDGFSDLAVSAVSFKTDQGAFYIYSGQASCTIGDVSYANGSVADNGCQICDTAKSTADWSNLPRATVCGEAMCSGDGFKTSACDGGGQCLEIPNLTDCGAYSCDANTNLCFTSCTVDADCEMGASCDMNQICITAKPTALISGESQSMCLATHILSASQSSDPAGAALRYVWTQDSGPNVLDGVDTSLEELSFSSPKVDVDTILTFSLIVKNATLDSDPVSFEVTVVGCPDTGDSADMGFSDSGNADIGKDIANSDLGGGDVESDSGVDQADGKLSGGGCGCMSTEKSDPKGPLFLILLLGFFVSFSKRKKHS